MIEELQAKLMEKQSALAKELGGDGSTAADDERQEQQRAEYARRGIALAAYEAETNTHPYFNNLDSDAFRSNRFMYILNKEITVFGAKGDIQLMSLAVLRDHCKVRLDQDNAYITAGKGDTYHNGKKLQEGKEELIKIYDRIAVGDQLMMFFWPGKEENDTEPMSAEDAVYEYQEGLVNARNNATQAVSTELDDERRKILEEREKWEKEKTEIKSKRDEQEFQRAMAAVDNSILDLLPKTKEAKQVVDLLNRVTMSFDVVLEKGTDGIPKVMISVENHTPTRANMTILIEPQEFLPKLSLLKDEIMKLRSAIDAGREYHVPEQHDPLNLMFDNDFHLGKCC